MPLKPSLVIALAVVAALLAGCGSSSTRTVTAVQTVTTASTPTTVVRATTAPAQTGCDVYESNPAENLQTGVIFQGIDVSGYCQNWQQNNAKQGELWWIVTDPTQGLPNACPTDPTKFYCGQPTQRCFLRAGEVTASVMSNDNDGASACEGLLAAGWRQATL